MAPPPERLPLTTLLSWTWIAFVIEADNAFEVASRTHFRRTFRISFAMWANGLRCISESGVTVDELRASSRAVCNLPGLERWGWVVLGDTGGGRGASNDLRRRDGYGSSRGVSPSTVVRPTAVGEFARREWPGILAHVEQQWEARFGADLVLALRSALGAGDDRLPWSPPEVRPSDGFWTHVCAPDAGGGGGGVLDPEGDRAAEDQPLSALLGKALTRRTLEHESASKASLPLACNGLRVLAGGPVAVRELPTRSGVSKEAGAMLAGFLTRNHLAEPGPDRSLALTAAGTAALEDYERRAASNGAAELRAALEALLACSAELAAGLEPPPGTWRGEAPHLKQTRRLLADPTGALPWQPMVLHRGGWPDGS